MEEMGLMEEMAAQIGFALGTKRFH